MLLLISAIAFFLLITGLILIHECGHFFMARLLGVTVEEFGFGLPPRAKRLFQWKGTVFTLNWIPFGGFVRLKGENVEHGKKPHARRCQPSHQWPHRYARVSGCCDTNQPTWWCRN